MDAALARKAESILAELKVSGLYKTERPLAGPQGGHIDVAEKGGRRELLNLCANNYLGLADHPEIIAAARAAFDEHGFGMASVRFICGTETLHLELERAIADYLGKDDAILFAACFDANGGLFEALLGEDDAIISDALNHASIIDGIRLCKAKRYRYANRDMNELEDAAQGGRPERRQIEDDRHRRRLLDGRHHRRPQGDLRPRRALRRDGDDRRLPRHRPSRREGPRHAGADRRRRPRRHHHRHLRQVARRRRSAGSSRRASRSSISSARRRGPTSSPTACRRRWSPARSRRSRSRKPRTTGGRC